MRVGGSEAAGRNVISGGYHGVQITGSGHIVEGNFIGTDVNGSAGGPTLANVLGVSILVGATGNVVGGSVPEAGNVIANPLGDGVHVFGDDNRIERNLIGRDATGLAASSHGLGVLVYGRRNVVRAPSAPLLTTGVLRPQA